MFYMFRHIEQENVTVEMDTTELYDGEAENSIRFVISITSTSSLLASTVEYSLALAHQYTVEYDV